MKTIFCRKTLVGLLAVCIACAFATACSRDPNARKEKYFESGKRYIAKGKFREAAIQLSNALRIDSSFAEAHYQLAMVDLKLGSAQNAYIELSRTVALQPDNAQAQLDLGNLLLVAGQAEKAQEYADNVLARDVNNVNAHVLKANVAAFQHQLDPALMEMSRAVELDPARANSYLSLAVLQNAKTPNSPDVETNLKKAIQLDPKSTRARLELATFYDRNKRFNEAEQQLQQALDTNTKEQAVHSGLIRHYLIQGRKDAAERAAKEAKAALTPNPDGVQFLARYYLAIGDAKSAISEYVQLSQQFPKERQIQSAYLELLMAKGKEDVAMQQAASILKHFPKDEQALIAKGILLIRKGKAKDGRDVLQSVIRADPKSVAAHYQLGNALNALGEKGQAELEWGEAARIEPAYLPAQRALAAVALSKHDITSLSQIAAILIKTAPAVPEGYLIQAEVDAFNHNAKDAEAQLEKAIQVGPSSTVAYVQLGRLRLALKRDVEAEDILDQALRIDPQDMQALSVLLQVYLDEKQPAKAMSRVEEVVANFPENAGAHFVFGQLALAQNDLDLAEKEFANAARLAPFDSAMYYQLGLVQVRRQEFSRAQSTFQAAVDKSPDDPNAYWMLGTVFEGENDAKNAEASYRKALQLRPDLAVAANNLAYLMLQNRGNIDQIITYAETARRLLPHSPAVADTLGWAYCQKGALELAIELLKDAVQGDPNSATYHYHLGMAYSGNGDRRNAKIELGKAIKLEGDQSKKENIQRSLGSLS